MKHSIRLAILQLVLGLTWASVAQAKGTKDATSLLKAAEAIRLPQLDYSVKITLEDKRAKSTEVNTYETSVKGRSKALVRFLSPAAEKGKELLFVDTDMWLYIPDSGKPVRVSARQRAAGNAVYGDIAQLNLQENYTAKLLRTDKFDGNDVQVLELNAIDGRQVSYDRIEYWIDAKDNRPRRCLYMTSEGKTLKEGVYSEYKTVLGGLHPLRLTITNVMRRTDVTTINLSEMKKVSLSDLLFQKQNLGRGSP